MIDTTLINYFFGKTILLIFSIIAIYAVIKLYNKYSKLLEFKIDSEMKQKVFEDLLLMKIAKDKGIDLQKELDKYTTKETNKRYVSEIIKDELQKMRKDDKDWGEVV